MKKNQPFSQSQYSKLLSLTKFVWGSSTLDETCYIIADFLRLELNLDSIAIFTFDSGCYKFIFKTNRFDLTLPVVTPLKNVFTQKGNWHLLTQENCCLGAIVFGEEPQVQPEDQALLNEVIEILKLSFFNIQSKLQFKKRHISSSYNSKVRELKADNQRLQDTLDLRSHFLSQMSHEIRTPLNAIVGLSELLEASNLAAEETEKVKSLNYASHMLLNLVDDILDLSKLHANAMGLEKKPFNLIEIIENVMKLYETNKTENTKICAKLEIRKNPICLGDERRFQQILCNLLSNACKFTEKGVISIGANRTSPEMVSFYISDTGIGVPDNRKLSIFDEFEQSNTPARKNYDGTGLGLSITKQIVTLMNGRIWVEDNEKDNRGSVFRFDLHLPELRQVKPQHSQDTSTLPPPQKQPLKDSQKTILVVDDTPMNIFLMKKLLSECRHKVEYSSGGLDSINKVEEKSFDFILMDLQMPDVTGEEATQKIRLIESQKLRKPATIYALTADAYKQFDEIEKFGFNGKLTKPIDRNALLDIIQNS